MAAKPDIEAGARPVVDHHELHRLCAAGRYLDAATDLLQSMPALMGQISLGTEEDGKSFMRQYVFRLLLERLHREAAALLWGPDIFDYRPRSVQLVWSMLEQHSDAYVIGAGSMGKTYSMGAWLLLDWWADPEWTVVKVISCTAKHAKDNLFGHICQLHKAASIPMPGIVMDAEVRSGTDSSRPGSIILQAIPPGSDSKSRLSGFHCKPRGSNHPKFGTHSRLRVVLDEAEGIPAGVWEGIGNAMLGSSGGDKHAIKVMAAGNPKKPNSEYLKRCEPPGGWAEVGDREVWVSARGKNVLRLDGARCENVVEKREIYKGFITWEGYQQQIADAGGTDRPAYWTMCRGLPPPEGAIQQVIDSRHIRVGTWVFDGATTQVMSVDVALEGDDDCVATFSRFGRAVGRVVKGVRESCTPRQAVQVTQQITFPKGDTVKLIIQVETMMSQAGIKGEWIILDRTGNGAGAHDILKDRHGCAGVNFSQGPTDTKVMAEDSMTCAELYDCITSEMFFAASKWLEHDIIMFAPGVPDRLAAELKGRRQLVRVQKKRKVESKRDYKARGNKSCDAADSFILNIHLIRIQSGWLPGILKEELPGDDVESPGIAWNPGVHAQQTLEDQVKTEMGGDDQAADPLKDTSPDDFSSSEGEDSRMW